jgi:hypothetical protein
MTTQQQMVKFSFRGDDLDVIKDGEKLWVSVTRVSEALGIDPKNQREKLKDKPWATGVLITSVGKDGKQREIFCLNLDALPMWLATIDVGRVAPEVQPKLVAYQLEAAKALRDYFFGGVAINPRMTDLELLRWRHQAVVELTMLARDALDPVFVSKMIGYSLAAIQGTEVANGPRLIDVSSYLQGKGLTDDLVHGSASRFGKALSALYLARFGEKPKKALRLINGSERPVSSYTEEHLDLFDQAFEAVFGRTRDHKTHEAA